MNSHILIVEDEELLREELQILLQNAGYGVTCITDFMDVAGQVRAGSYDLILLDVTCPVRTATASVPEYAPFPVPPSCFSPGAVRRWTSFRR